MAGMPTLAELHGQEDPHRGYRPNLFQANLVF
jgi:hypothetical protein